VTFPEISPYVPLLGPYQFDLGGWHVGPLGIRWYALAYIAGIVLGWRYAVALVRSPRLWGDSKPTATPVQIDDLILWITLGVVAGGRLGSVLFYNTAVIWRNPAEIFQIWNGGMSFHGGMIGVILALAWFARSHRINALRLGDLIAPCVPFGLFFGRIANFINAELWGRPTSLPWGMVFCNHTIMHEYHGCPAGLMPRHPSELYEASLEGIALFLILRWATHKALWLRKRGAVTGLFLVCYALFRISLENVREPDVGMPNFPFGLTMGMILSIPMALAGLWLIWRGLKAGDDAAPVSAEAHES
jgi:phosphatidylglycerol:prolipoprotein diacylglycerol transferase